MKTNIIRYCAVLIIASLFQMIAITVFAQAPTKFNYQAICRDNLGSIISGQPVTLRLTIHDLLPGGITLYKETHYVTTNSFGLVTVTVGGGTADTGSFAAIQWGTGDKYLQVELNTGSGFNTAGTTQLLSVPYALYAEKSGAGGVTGPTGPTGATGSAGPPGFLSNSSNTGSTPYWDGTQWQVNSMNIYNNGGNVGINNPSPSQKLDVGGAINIADASTSTTGAIRYHNFDFEGYGLGQWLSFTRVKYQTFNPGNYLISNIRNSWVYAGDTAVVQETGYYLVIFNITDGFNNGVYTSTGGNYDLSVTTAVYYKRGFNPLAPAVYGIPFFQMYQDFGPIASYFKYIPATGSLSSIASLQAGDKLIAGMHVLSTGAPTDNVGYYYNVILVKLNP